MFFSKGSRLQAVSWIVLSVFATSCASGGMRPQGGRPGQPSVSEDQEIVRANPQKSIGYVWNRWSEDTDSKIMINSGEVIASRYLPKVLELNTDAKVTASMDQYRKWSGFAQISAMVLAASLVSTGIGYIRTTEGSTTLPIPVINVLWGVTGLAMGATALSLIKQESYLNDAHFLHNQQSRGLKASRADFSLAWRFEF